MKHRSYDNNDVCIIGDRFHDHDRNNNNNLRET